MEEGGQVKGSADESVGASFRADLLQAARDRSLAVLLQLRARIQPGTTELEAKQALLEIQTAAGAPKSWHPPQLRFGENTLLPFGQRGIENNTLAANDIFFLDIGPIFDGHEGDVGRAFAVGNDPEMHRCCADVEAIWQEVREHWRASGDNGKALYDFATARAEARGWKLALDQANGHRIADFPHAAKARGSIENFGGKPAPDRWILEVQIRHPTRSFGAFFEDLLN